MQYTIHRVKDGIVIVHTVVGRHPAPVELGSLSHYLQLFLHPR